MRKFNSLYQAASLASTLSKGWSFSTSDERYDTESLLTISEVHDSENPADEDSFYLVSNDGSIGFCDDEEHIDWLFISDLCDLDNLPESYTSIPQVNFCSNCGTPVVDGANFCGSCGLSFKDI